MDLSALFRRGPYTAFPRSFSPLPHPSLLGATWQVVSSPSGVPAVQLQFNFPPYGAGVSNPDMTLALLLDRSGSMGEAYRDGHVYNLASTILQRLQIVGTGFDLVFYNGDASFVGHIDSDAALSTAIRNHQPGGGTYVCDALRGTVKRYRKQKGLYIIVITDGEFADKQAAQNLVVQEFLPQLTPDNPFAFRLHFVGAGPEVDREFLEQLEKAASSGGVAMVSGHHHAHLSHAHLTIQQEMERSFLGVGRSVEFRRPEVPDAESHHVARVAQQGAQNWHSGDDDQFGFLPINSTWLVEVAPTTASHLRLQVLWSTDSGPDTMDLVVPFVAPQARAAGWHFHWPWASETDRARVEERRVRQQAELDASQERAREDLKALARGGIPVQARQRLKELKEDPNALFTSDLDPSEAALLRRVGYRPVALVTGSAMYHVGQAYASTQDCEVPVMSHAYDEATRLAVSRMEAEVKVVGAHGVIGVRFDMTQREWGDKTIEVMVVGTAVVGPGPAPDEPFLCDLSGHEWWALRRAGYEPRELVWGHCSWFIFTDSNDQWILQNWQNQELTHWSQGLSRARTLALKRVHEMAQAERATGVVGVSIQRRLSEVRLVGNELEHHTLLVSILGTAIRPMAAAPQKVPASAMVLSLLDGSMMPVGVLRETDAKFE
ncbi:MAG TPA: heavy metal-binding domain-containing protein [Candidatus Xenobia bacterium]|jgi:uncharacterized protein YbjQ (UPF0145 family)